MKRVLLLFVFPVLGCATGGSGDPDLLGAPQVRTVIAGSVSGGEGGGDGTGTVRYVDEPVLVEEVLPSSRDEVWPQLLEAYRGEGLVPDGMDSRTGLITVSRVEWVRERNGLPISTFLDCGPSATGRPLADDARIVSSVATQVVGGETGPTRLVTRVEAVAYPTDASSGGARGCTTKGELERGLVARVQAALDPVEVQGLGVDPGVRAGAGVATSERPTPTASPVMADESSLPFQPGDQLRVWVTGAGRLSGSYMGLRPDSLLLRRSRRTAIPLYGIESVTVKRTSTRAVVLGTILGAATGVALAMNTELGIVGRHSVQGELLNPGLGALGGGLAGGIIGTIFFDSWEDVPLVLLGISPPGTGRQLP